MDTYKMILASGSPRRKELLEMAGYDFTVEVSDAEEEIREKDPARMVERLSGIKAMAVCRQYSGRGPEESMESCPGDEKERQALPVEKRVIIGADTVVVHRGQILGKPGDKAQAAAMIRELAGDTHQVFTGVTLVLLSGQRIGKILHFHEKTDVHLRQMTEEEISSYVEAREPVDREHPEKGERYLWQDKAGGYGIQTGWGSRMITGITGDYYNVVGLPVCRLSTELSRLFDRHR